MKCRYCGAELHEEDIVCPICGTELQIVPDYNPLDDDLEDQIRGSVNRTLEERRQNTGNMRTTDRKSERDERERRRKRAEKRRMLEKKRRQKLLLIGIGAIVILIGAIFLGYQNSYTGQVKKGYKYLNEKNYYDAMTCFQKAAEKDEEREEAYVGMADVYIAQHETEKGEQLFLEILEKQPDNIDFYKALIQFYIDTKQESKIAYLLADCDNDIILDQLTEYQVEIPAFGLEEDKIYDDVQALELTSEGNVIYYTIDGSTPTTASKKYSEPIKLEEGTTTLKAIAVNANHIPSMVVTKEYTIAFPIADAPSVTPSTGQYEEAQKIKVVVPDKYEAYYTMDGSEPDPESIQTKKYSGEIDMPEGNTIFKVVLVDQNGRISDMTIRNYELIIDEEE